ncbi:MAG: 30S ribosomal protein S6 [Patescibacteria group bacterium]
MTNYELLFIVPAKISDKEISQVAEKVAKIIAEEGGSITKEDNLGRFKLSYPIKKNDVGTYLLFQFDGDNSIVAKLEKIFKLTPELLRYIITITPPFREKAVREPRTPELTQKPKDSKTKRTAKTKTKISLEDLEEKLDTILDDDILK